MYTYICKSLPIHTPLNPIYVSKYLYTHTHTHTRACVCVCHVCVCVCVCVCVVCMWAHLAITVDINAGGLLELVEHLPGGNQ